MYCIDRSPLQKYCNVQVHVRVMFRAREGKQEVRLLGDVNPAKTQVRDPRPQAHGLCSHGLDRPDLPRDKGYNGAQRWPLNIDTIRKTAVHPINYLT
jgi:hypothetical protein